MRPAGNHPPGHRFETGTLSHEALAGFVAAVGYLESLGSDDADRLGGAYQAIAAHELELAETFLARLHTLPDWRLLGIRDTDPDRRVPTFGLLCDRAAPDVLARELGRHGCYSWNGNFYALNLVRALGLDEEQDMLRIGFTHYNTSDEVNRLLDHLAAL